MGVLKDIVIFLGPPGSGKGTLSKLCSENLGWQQLSTGDLCRKHIAEGTEVGKAIDFAIKSGKLVSDSLISQMVDEWFASGHHQGEAAILDGYPRTVNQAKLLFETLQKDFPQLQLRVVFFDVPDECVIKRLGARYICSHKECQAVYSLAPDSSLSPKKEGLCDSCGCPLVRRPDDREETIKARLESYHQHVNGLLDFYNKVGQKVIRVEADRSLDQVFDIFKKKIGANVA